MPLQVGDYNRSMKRLLKVTGTALLAVVSVAVAAIDVVPLPTELPDIPQGHLPPPGEYRIWLPEEPAGHQAPPGSCADLAREVSLGSWLIYRATSGAVEITAYSTDTKNLVGEVAFYDTETHARLESSPATVSIPELEVPKGHLPPPGECKVWFPDQPAGHQPPPGDCAELSGDVPPGAWLLYGSAADEVVATAYHPEVEGLVVKVETLDD